ncbi:MAG: phytanoyl-CoA dioxygenase, partial [Candidatus Poribacteria bacterium]|nr:phytanoyl-CoA dioxygenase [Candidatus Poribacteria bacterium]
RPSIVPTTGGARGQISVNMKPGGAFFFEQRTYHGEGHNYYDQPRKTVFIGYAYRWVKPMDYIEMPDELVERANPIQRQLLGVVDDALSFYLPQENDVPLKAIYQERASS